MVDVNALKAAIVKQGKTQKQVYEELGMTKRQWENRMSVAKFDSNEIYAIKNTVPISSEDFMPIFFMGCK